MNKPKKSLQNLSPRQQVLTGWGSTNPTRATTVALPPNQMTSTITAENAARGARRGILARGLGRAYNDAAQNAGGLVFCLAGVDVGVDLDKETGVAIVRGGTSIGQIIDASVPHGWFVPVTPGTRHVTIGGAVAADIHGKNHHRHGSIGEHIIGLTLDSPTGRHSLSPKDNADQFFATVGGLGLTGVIRDVTIQLIRIESPLMWARTFRAAGLDDLLTYLSHDDATYSVAWVDGSATGRHLGRAVITTGEHASSAQLQKRNRSLFKGLVGGSALTIPFLPITAVRPISATVFNELTFHSSSQHRHDALQSIGRFFHPLDSVQNWNRLYGPHGFVQWQCAVPSEKSEVIGRVLETLTTNRLVSPVTVLKRFGRASPAPLSFPIPGWTLALDLPVTDNLRGVLDKLDDMVVRANGRLYLAKDGRMSPHLLPNMYPRLNEWRAWRDVLDPEHDGKTPRARRYSKP